MNPDEAREEAWRAFVDAHARYALSGGDVRPGPPSQFNYAWDARGRYDEQRIADLVAWVEDALNTGDIGLVLYERGEALLRARGQSEEVKP